MGHSGAGSAGTLESVAAWALVAVVLDERDERRGVGRLAHLFVEPCGCGDGIGCVGIRGNDDAVGGEGLEIGLRRRIEPVVLEEDAAGLQDPDLGRPGQGSVEDADGTRAGGMRARRRWIGEVLDLVVCQHVDERLLVERFADGRRAHTAVGVVATASGGHEPQRDGDRSSEMPPGHPTRVPYTGAMSRSQVERHLVELGDRLKRMRDDLRVADEQLAHFADEADDARLRSLVSETPLADREHRDAERHADAMRRHRQELADEIEQLERRQDELLDRLTAEI